MHRVQQFHEPLGAVAVQTFGVDVLVRAWTIGDHASKKLHCDRLGAYQALQCLVAAVSCPGVHSREMHVVSADQRSCLVVDNHSGCMGLCIDPTTACASA